MYYTYILWNSITQRYYIGYTPDLRSRLKTHFTGKVKSTKSDPHYVLKWYCSFPDKDMALKMERYLKSGSGRAFMKKRLLKSDAVALVKDNITSDGLPAEASA
jgi:putative endonuclease